MGQRMPDEELFLKKSHATDITFELLFAQMEPQVSLKLVLDVENFVTKVTFELSNSILMRFQMSVELMPRLQNLITNVTFEALALLFDQALLTVDFLQMSFEDICPAEKFITSLAFELLSLVRGEVSL